MRKRQGRVNWTRDEGKRMTLDRWNLPVAESHPAPFTRSCRFVFHSHLHSLPAERSEPQARANAKRRERM